VLDRLQEVLDGGMPVDLTLDNTPTAFTEEPRLRYRVRLAPLKDRQGEVDGAVILQEDLSERARLEAQLIRSEKLSSVGVLAAGVAHEINNPLTTILGYAKLLLEDRGEEDPDRSALELVADESRRVQEIVRNLLDFSRQESGELLPTAVNELVERTSNLVAPDLRKRGIDVAQKLEADLPQVLADARRIEQVFVNLITNAAHAMPDGGTLTLRTGHDPRRPHAIFTEFTDTGAGISADLLPRVFDPFFTTKEPGQGTGLGLAISQRIVTDHGGELEVQSLPGAGTTFKVWLPCVDESRIDEG
jgi:signal transduction histidine kinase